MHHYPPLNKNVTAGRNCSALVSVTRSMYLFLLQKIRLEKNVLFVLKHSSEAKALLQIPKQYF